MENWKFTQLFNISANFNKCWITEWMSLSQDPKSYCLLIRMSLNHENMFVWNALIWIRGPYRHFLTSFDQFEQVWTILDKSRQFWTSLKFMITVQVNASLYCQFLHFNLDMFRHFRPSLTNLSKFGQVWTSLDKFGQVWNLYLPCKSMRRCFQFGQV